MNADSQTYGRRLILGSAATLVVVAISAGEDPPAKKAVAVPRAVSKSAGASQNATESKRGALTDQMVRAQRDEERISKVAAAYPTYDKYRDLVLIDLAEYEVERALSRPISMHFSGTPLQEIVQYFCDFTNHNILLDANGLKSAQVADDRPVTIDLGPVTLRSALRSLLTPLHLTFIVRDGGILITDTKTAAEQSLRVYPVGDLVSIKAKKEIVNTADELIQSIQDVVNPSAWEDSGGENRLRYHATTLSLLVNADYATHKHVEAMIVKLREAMQKAREFAERSDLAPLEKLQLAEPQIVSDQCSADESADDGTTEKEEVLNVRVTLNGSAANLLKAVTAALEKFPGGKSK